MLSKAATEHLRYFRHIVLHSRTFSPPIATRSFSISKARSLARTTAKARALLPQVIIAAKWLRTIRIDRVSQSVLFSSRYPREFPEHRLEAAHIDYLYAPPSILQHITHLSLDTISPSLHAKLRGEAVFLFLKSFSGPLDVFTTLSHHHRLEGITLRDTHTQPSWISWREDVQALSSALKRVPAKSLVVGIDLVGGPSLMRSFWRQLATCAPELESLAITLRFTGVTSADEWTQCVSPFPTDLLICPLTFI